MPSDKSALTETIVQLLWLHLSHLLSVLGLLLFRSKPSILFLKMWWNEMRIFYLCITNWVFFNSIQLDFYSCSNTDRHSPGAWQKPRAWSPWNKQQWLSGAMVDRRRGGETPGGRTEGGKDRTHKSYMQKHEATRKCWHHCCYQECTHTLWRNIWNKLEEMTCKEFGPSLTPVYMSQKKGAGPQSNSDYSQTLKNKYRI